MSTPEFLGWVNSFLQTNAFLPIIYGMVIIRAGIWVIYYLFGGRD